MDPKFGIGCCLYLIFFVSFFLSLKFWHSISSPISPLLSFVILSLSFFLVLINHCTGFGPSRPFKKKGSIVVSRQVARCDGAGPEGVVVWTMWRVVAGGVLEVWWRGGRRTAMRRCGGQRPVVRRPTQGAGVDDVGCGRNKRIGERDRGRKIKKEKQLLTDPLQLTHYHFILRVSKPNEPS
jgi:hypothetical protein